MPGAEAPYDPASASPREIILPEVSCPPEVFSASATGSLAICNPNAPSKPPAPKLNFLPTNFRARFIPALPLSILCNCALGAIAGALAFFANAAGILVFLKALPCKACRPMFPAPVARSLPPRTKLPNFCIPN